MNRLIRYFIYRYYRRQFQKYLKFLAAQFLDEIEKQEKVEKAIASGDFVIVEEPRGNCCKDGVIVKDEIVWFNQN